jgi:NADPH:quinone reductase-like Zn-dependent oxidoreductase
MGNTQPRAAIIPGSDLFRRFYTDTFTERKGRAHHGGILREATTIIEAGKLKPLMAPRHFTMDTVEDAYAALENKIGKGKVVLDIGA